MAARTFTGVFQQTPDGWWVAWTEELPGANTQGQTLAEARENLIEAIQLILTVNREDAAQTDQPLIREEFTVAV